MAGFIRQTGADGAQGWLLSGRERFTGRPRVALTLAEGTDQDVWIYETRRDAMTRLTFGGAVYRYPRWSSDGRYVVFADVGKGIVQARADGGSRPQA